MVALLIIYRAIRTLNKTDMRVAFTNARSVIRLENWLGLPFEDNLQSWLIDHPTLIKLLNHYYIFFHFPAAIGFCCGCTCGNRGTTSRSAT